MVQAQRVMLATVLLLQQPSDAKSFMYLHHTVLLLTNAVHSSVGALHLF